MSQGIVRAKSATVVEALARISEVKAILCFGSYATGAFDQYSDLDLYVLCDPEIVSAPVRREILQERRLSDHSRRY